MADILTDKERTITPGVRKLIYQTQNFRGPEEGRFGIRIGTNLAKHELHIPNDLPNPILNGNSTSWSLWPTERLKKIWSDIKYRIDKPHEQEKIQEEIVVDAKNGISELGKKLNVSIDQIIAFASGSDAIIAGKSFLGNFQNSVGTTETGSDVGKGLKTTGEYIEIELRDINNNLIPENILFENWKTKIDQNPNAYFVLTLVSKTGTYYPELTTNVLDYLQTKNKIAVVDAIQANGRIPKEEVLKYLKHRACKGITITGSKAFGASTHAGFLITNNSGIEITIAAQELVDKYGAFNSLFNTSVDYENNLVELIRVADNAYAIAEKIDGDYLYGNKAEEYIAVYKEVFAKLGFKILKDEGFKKVTSIISMELPGINPLKIHDFLTELAKVVGITLAGPMQRLGGRPIFRFGLSTDLAQDKNIDSKILREKLKDLGTKFAQAKDNME